LPSIDRRGDHVAPRTIQRYDAARYIVSGLIIHDALHHFSRKFAETQYRGFSPINQLLSRHDRFMVFSTDF
jgi:hypothetical protein